MRVVLRDPPLFMLLAAIMLNLPVARVRRLAEPRSKPAGWAFRQVERLLQWRDAFSRRA